MPDNKNLTHPLDAKRIDVNDPSEVSNWCTSLSCTKAELLAAVIAVGTSGKAVRAYLGK